ncbi:hypothetical protein FACS189414_4140 [Bacteroidia bacterium]|nr:hypothetical protein FACS189414_4140 [Bacteroidia bacterium]
MRSITIEINEVLDSQKVKNENFGKATQFKDFEEAVKKFNQLVEKGVTAPRGYNLMTIENKMN